MNEGGKRRGRGKEVNKEKLTLKLLFSNRGAPKRVLLFNSHLPLLLFSFALVVQRTSHSKGRWRRISSGSVSAAITINSAIPRFSVLVAKQGKDEKNEKEKSWKRKKKKEKKK